MNNEVPPASGETDDQSNSHSFCRWQQSVFLEDPYSLRKIAEQHEAVDDEVRAAARYERFLGIHHPVL